MVEIVPQKSVDLLEEIDYETLPTGAPFSSHLLAGALAGITEHSVTYPFDMIKVLKILFNLK